MHQNKLLAIVVVVVGILGSLAIVSNIGISPGECITVTFFGDSGVERCKEGNSNLSAQQASDFKTILSKMTQLEIQKLETEKQMILQSDQQDSEKISLIEQSIKNIEIRETKNLETLPYLQPSDYELLQQNLDQIKSELEQIIVVPPSVGGSGNLVNCLDGTKLVDGVCVTIIPSGECDKGYEMIDGECKNPIKVKTDIANDIKVNLHKKISEDIYVIRSGFEGNEIQKSFDSKYIIDDTFISCGDEDESHTKCEKLKDVKSFIESKYAFIFYYPNMMINNSDKMTSEDCIIEISTLNSVRTKNIENKWNDRQWCNSEKSILMTDQYNPRNDPSMNVNSLLMKYRDFNGDTLGIVNAYNLEKFIDIYVKDSDFSTFNVILLDNQNCVAAAVSKTNGDTTKHMDKNIWQISDEIEPNTFEISKKNIRNEIENTNCGNEFSDYALDPFTFVHIVAIENPGLGFSKLDGKYSTFEMKPITDGEANEDNVHIFENWHLLVSTN
ncbi:MAG: hypothetical protein GKS07_07150 [Nitrosopumilus sp.]|nr:MAG: hypothetical protein GKS07_07150 [Nitrosopumilus sp.]